MRLGASTRCPARPHRHPPAPRPALAALIAEPTPNFARNSPTTASSFEFRPLELQRFQTSLKLHSIELRATFLEGRTRDCPRRPQPGPLESQPSHTPTPQASRPAFTPNFARNSPTTASSFELRSLELQRFPTLLNLLPIELRATFWGSDSEHHHGHRSQASPPASRPHKRDKIRPARLKPMTPMRVDHCHEMKPPAPLRAPRRTRLKPLTPLLAQKSQLQAIFHPQRRHGFHAPLAGYPQRRRRFHHRRTLRPQPKPRVACAKTATPVAHWPHD